MHQAVSLDDLVRLTGKRSVYSEAKLAAFDATAHRPVKVIDFLLVGHIEPAIKLDDLRRMGVFRGAPPQSISQLTEDRFRTCSQSHGIWVRRLMAKVVAVLGLSA